MARTRTHCQWRTAALIWSTSFILFYIVFRSATNHNSVSLGSGSDSDRRSRLYDELERDLEVHGTRFLEGGETSQSLSLSDLFELKDGSVKPILRAANPPVRANVLHMDAAYSIPISQAVKEIFLPYLDGVMWFQNTSLYHFSMFHASHHLTPIIANDNEIEAEANAVKAVAEALCPLKIVLDRVVLTSTGVLLGCWQVKSGTDPTMIRAKLRNALPRAPEKQLYDPVLLHTSFARLLGHPKVPVEPEENRDIMLELALPNLVGAIEHHELCKPSETNDEMKRPFDQLKFFHKLVEHANNKLHGYEATVTELWYVEEYDVLALALNGRMKTRKFRLGCAKN